MENCKQSCTNIDGNLSHFIHDGSFYSAPIKYIFNFGNSATYITWHEYFQEGIERACTFYIENIVILEYVHRFPGLIFKIQYLERHSY